jgi:hypothetical protein
MDNRLPILIACYPCRSLRPDDVLGCAMTEDGQVLGEHLSSSESYSQHDMGLTSDWKHDRYCAAAFPFGYELIWIGSAYKSDQRWVAALAKNHERHPVTEDAAGAER